MSRIWTFFNTHMHELAEDIDKVVSVVMENEDGKCSYMECI